MSRLSQVYVPAPAKSKRKGREKSNDGKELRGFALLDQTTLSEISRKGGRTAHRMGLAHEFTRQEAGEAGRRSAAVNQGNHGFASMDDDRHREISALGGKTHDRDHFVGAGRKGGNAVSQGEEGRKHMAALARKSNEVQSLRRQEQKKLTATTIDATPTTVSTEPAKPKRRSGLGTQARGFASMDQRRQREIASMGGQAVRDQGRLHVFTKDEQRRGSVAAGTLVSRDRSHMAAIGRRGGENSRDKSPRAKRTRKPRATENEISTSESS